MKAGAKKTSVMSNTKSIFHVALHNPNEWGKVSGWRVTIVGFECWRFFVHRDPLNATSRSYRVSEVTTGMKVPDSEGRSKTQAVLLAEKSLRTVGPVKFEKAHKLGLRQLKSKKVGLGRAPEPIAAP